MKRVLAVADTHGRLRDLDYLALTAGKIDLLLHLGDYAPDARLMGEALGVPYLAVRGNNDFTEEYPVKRIVEVEKAKLLMLHREELFRRASLLAEARQNGCGAILFAHTHVPYLAAEGNVQLLNPGSYSLPRACSERSYAILTIDGGDIRIEMRTLD